MAFSEPTDHVPFVRFMTEPSWKLTYDMPVKTAF
jgi:hypothetical protein